MKTKDILSIIGTPLWKWGVFMLEGFVGLVGFFSQNPIFDSWQNFSVLLPIPLWIFAGTVLWTIGTTYQAVTTWNRIKNGIPKINFKYHEKNDFGKGFSILITSGSEKPINITNACLVLKNKERVFYSDLFKSQINLPVVPKQKLGYGDRIEYVFNIFDVKFIVRESFSPVEVVGVEVFDTFDNIFKFPETLDERISFWKIKRFFKKDWEKYGWNLEKPKQNISPVVFTPRKPKSDKPVIKRRKVSKTRNKK